MNRAGGVLLAIGLLASASQFFACRRDAPVTETRDGDTPPAASPRGAAVSSAAVSSTAVPSAAVSAAAVSPGLAKPGPIPLDRTELHVPRFPEAIVIDGEYQQKKIWEKGAVKTPIFVTAAGTGMVPYTDTRFAWGHGFLYVLSYSGDLDIVAKEKKRGADLSKDDYLHIEISGPRYQYMIDVSPILTLSEKRCKRGEGDAGRENCEPWESHLKVGVDVDGTPNQRGDYDEEWILEMSIPLAALEIEEKPGARFGVALRRCEVDHVGVHECGTWGMGAKPGTLILDDGVAAAR